LFSKEVHERLAIASINYCQMNQCEQDTLAVKYIFTACLMEIKILIQKQE